MRLTLRTLLAYLDGILDSGDSEDLGKKVEESDYASGLIHRIRDVMRRQRLGAPSLTERGPGLDPNTVAEYLDNTLASERIIDFEKVCLDSDIHLAEVASSHQILTLVLGEPAEVDPAARERMYRLAETKEQVQPPPAPTVHTTLDSPEQETPPQLDLEPKKTEPAEPKPRQKPTVPEYLREPRKKSPWLSIAAGLLLVVCVTGVVLWAFGQFEQGSTIGNMFVDWGLISPSPDEELAQKPPKDDAGQKPEVPPAADTPETTELPDNEPVETPTDTPPVVSDQPVQPPPSEPVEPPPVEPVAPPPEATPPAETVPPAETTPKVEPEEPPVASQPPPDLPPEPLGRLMSSEQVLLSNGVGGGWARVAANQMLVPQEVMTLPTYRAKIALTIGVTMEVLGGTRVELLGSSPSELPGIRVRDGRVVLMPLGKVGLQVRVAFGDRSGTITFNDADAVVALDVGRLRVPGSNPEIGLDRIVADLYVATGHIAWRELVDGIFTQPVELAPSQCLSFDAKLTSAPTDVRELPPWIESSAISALDRRASTAIADALPTTDRLVRVGLMELAVSRPQKEVKWLAWRCLGYVGQFDDVVTALNDPEYKLVWSDYVDMLRAAVARDAETAAAVRATLEKQYSQQALIMYRLLWGYTDKDLQSGEDAALVRGLDDELLAVRVLSYWNLKEITGQGAAFQPEQTAARRQQSVRRWRQRLNAKEIRYNPGQDEPVKPDETPPAADK